MNQAFSPVIIDKETLVETIAEFEANWIAVPFLDLNMCCY
jgi:hypothetical protein